MIQPGTITRAVNGEEVANGTRVEAEIYRELRDIVAGVLTQWGRSGARADFTVVVHETWIKLRCTRHWENRAHFYGSAARAVRQVLADQARRRGAEKRRPRPDAPTAAESAEPLLVVSELESALERLALVDARAEKVAVLRLYGDLEPSVIAEILGISVRTVNRDWRFARSWLMEALHGA